MSRKGGLGKGLGALIPADAAPSSSGATNIPIEKIAPNPRQPRQDIENAELMDLAASIKIHGILQPLIVTYEPFTDRYTLIAGERRLRAAKQCGFSMVPVLIRQASDQERLELALIENLQRSDLSALDTACAYQQLCEEFNLTHEEIGAQVGKSREAVSNSLRLLKLHEIVKKSLANGNLSEGHARTLLGLATSQQQVAAHDTILKFSLNVRQTEELVKRLNGERVKRPTSKQPEAEISSIEEKLRTFFGTKVSLLHSKKGGRLVIHYYSDEELDALINLILKE